MPLCFVMAHLSLTSSTPEGNTLEWNARNSNLMVEWYWCSKVNFLCAMWNHASVPILYVAMSKYAKLKWAHMGPLFSMASTPLHINFMLLCRLEALWGKEPLFTLSKMHLAHWCYVLSPPNTASIVCMCYTQQCALLFLSKWVFQYLDLFH